MYIYIYIPKKVTCGSRGSQWLDFQFRRHSAFPCAVWVKFARRPSLFPILFGEFLLPVFFLKRGGSGRVSAAAYINLKTSWSFEDPFADCTI